MLVSLGLAPRLIFLSEEASNICPLKDQTDNNLFFTHNKGTFFTKGVSLVVKSSLKKKVERFLDFVRLHPETNKEALIELRSEGKNNDWIAAAAKAITLYAFRNGPVETMHANCQLSQADMKTLNKYMVNHIAHVIKMLIEGRWLEFQMLIIAYSMYAQDWDEPEIDEEGFKAAIGVALMLYGRGG